MDQQTFFARIIAASLCSGVTALVWDGWWHVAVGRDTFWEPPHLLLYGSIMITLLSSIYAWRKFRIIIWRRLAIATFIVPLSAPFDEAWHRWFGVENLNSVLIIWSPPHLALFGSLIASLVLVLPLLRQDMTPVRNFLESYIFAVILAISLGIVAPFYPFGPYKLLGFWGAGILAAVVIWFFFLASRQRQLGASSLAIFFLALYFLQDTTARASGVDIQPFPHIPQFIFFSATLMSALFIDIVKISGIMRGVLAGLLYGTLLYGFTSGFLPAMFQYTGTDIVVAVTSCTIGGFFSGILAKTFQKSSTK